ncbi:hypothetical protein SAMN05216344_10561 [Polaromonas sp. OV174]|uniref:hypothetical protein n=1 Tax=Polaromonas sp. OV174 TaxID=1855300 RepID=UPI0008E9E659|nr:hypothetical protein [Polaromonas sp. OV174]SFB90239.1 hypothetical protein SAMN05216344_10561 [Polaromonas sp. OV174]
MPEQQVAVFAAVSNELFRNSLRGKSEDFAPPNRPVANDSNWWRIQPVDATHYDPPQAEGVLQMKYRTRTYYTDSQHAILKRAGRQDINRRLDGTSSALKK